MWDMKLSQGKERRVGWGGPVLAEGTRPTQSEEGEGSSLRLLSTPELTAFLDSPSALSLQLRCLVPLSSQPFPSHLPSRMLDGH